MQSTNFQQLIEDPDLVSLRFVSRAF